VKAPLPPPPPGHYLLLPRPHLYLSLPPHRAVAPYTFFSPTRGSSRTVSKQKMEHSAGFEGRVVKSLFTNTALDVPSPPPLMSNKQTNTKRPSVKEEERRKDLLSHTDVRTRTRSALPQVQVKNKTGEFILVSLKVVMVLRWHRSLQTHWQRARVCVCVRLVHSPDAVLGAAVALYRILLEGELLKGGEVYTSARGTSVRQHERQPVPIKRVRAGRGARGEGRVGQEGGGGVSR
jgi:hypothetical protein